MSFGNSALQVRHPADPITGSLSSCSGVALKPAAFDGGQRDTCHERILPQTFPLELNREPRNLVHLGLWLEVPLDHEGAPPPCIRESTRIQVTPDALKSAAR